MAKTSTTSTGCEGHASSDTGADVWHNEIVSQGFGEEGADPGPQWRYVRVRIVKQGLGKQQHNAVNFNLPGEVQGGGGGSR